MNTIRSTRFSFAGMFAAALLVAGLLGGCGGNSGDQASETLNMVTVNWIEGMALTYLQAHLLDDSLGVEVDIREVNGGGIAFSSVASGDRHYFNEAWLPTTHQEPWKKHKENLQKLGYTYRGTTVGLAVPSYVEIDTIPDLMEYQEELNGTINGIEAGAAINGQTRSTLEQYGLSDEFRVAAASGPANWQALKSAIQGKRPIVVTAWYPHWIWNRYDLKYIGGAKTNHNVDIWGGPEAIFSLVDNGFVERFSEEAVCFLKEFEANDEQVFSLMTAFTERGGQSKSAVVQQWTEDHPKAVEGWMRQARECAASESPPQVLPDSATYSPDSGPTDA